MVDNIPAAPDVSLDFDINEPRPAGHFLKSLMHMLNEIGGPTEEQKDTLRKLCKSCIDANIHLMQKYDENTKKKIESHQKRANEYMEEFKRIEAFAQEDPAAQDEKALEKIKSFFALGKLALKKDIAKHKKEKKALEESTIKMREDHKQEIQQMEEDHNDAMRKILLDIAALKLEYLSK